MGMFDYVHFEMDCPKCNAKITDFQSKDKTCKMETIEPDSLISFYSSCKCGAWVEFRRPRPKISPLRDTALTPDEVAAMGFVMDVV